jgi:PDZ domain/PEGA domain
MTTASYPRLFAAVLALLVACTAWSTAAPQENAEALYQEARRLFDALDYEKAVVALDQAITALQAGPATDATRRERLASAYEMRARSKFGLGDQDGAKADFVLLLKTSPSHALSGQVSPRVVALFEETVKQTVTNLTLAVTPATAKIELDGVPMPGPGTIRVAAGEHVVSAEQAGFRPLKQTVVTQAETPAELTIALERLSSVIRVVTTPPGVEVKVDGKVAGRTAPAAEAAGAAAETTPSAPLLVGDVATGAHTVELRRDCFVPVTQRVDVERPDDYTVGPVTLRPAVATVSITATQQRAQVFIDGRERGVTPLKVTDLCEGPHVVEFRTPFGSDSKRLDAKAGADLTVEGNLKPAFAIVSVSGPTPAQADLRVIVERVFAAAQSVRLVAPPADEAEKALKANQLSADWLATDAAGRPVGASAQLAGAVRNELSSKLADAFRAQGVASVTALDASRVIVALLSAGSGTPDVLEVTLDNPQSVAAAVSKLDRVTALSRPSIGLQAIDVADVAGAVIVHVDPTGPAAASGARVGDVVVQADGKPVSDAAALSQLVVAHRPGDAISLELRDAAGTPKRVDVKALPTPRLIGLSEYGVLANRILLDLRPRLSDASDPFDQSVLRLNVAVALARLGDWRGAREELERVKLPDQAGVGLGTVQYLIGLAAEKTGNRAEAEAAFKAAAASGSLLTEDGPGVKELAEAKLLELQKAPR